MRLFDLLLLSLAALWQQKLRTVLTTLGVAFGGLVLFVSLSIGQGVQEAIVHEYRKHEALRTIGVSNRYEAKVEEIPAEVLEIKGDMPAERRERLKHTIQVRWAPNVENKPESSITAGTLIELANLEHVARVRPVTFLSGPAKLADKAETVRAQGISPQDESFRKQLLLGGPWTSPTAQEAMISEFLAYRWGIGSDAELTEVVGKTIQVEFRGFREARTNYYFGFGRRPGFTGLEAEELQRKLHRMLPEAIAKLDLSPEERSLLETLLKPPNPDTPPAKEVTLRAEFKIAGVFRMPTREDQRRLWEGVDYQTDLWLPLETAKGLYLQMPYAEQGFGYVVVLVDEEKNVKQVLEQIEAMGYRCAAAIQFIERELFLYKLIFAGMSCIAGVALLVAGLGITNTMLMSVLERTREVGIMKAVGAAEGHIQLIFLIEGALIGLVGGVLGVLGSWGFSIPGDRWIRGQVATELKVELEESLFQFPPWLIVAVIAFCALVTTLAAVYPARRAARVNPVTALRHE